MYATADDVKALFRNFATSTEAAVTDTKIETWLESAFAMINARIGVLYQLPITDATNPESYKILAQIEAFYVAGIVDDVLNTYSEADKKPQWGERAKYMLNEYAPQLDKNGVQPKPISVLPDATFLGTPSQKNTPRFQPNTTPIFSKGGDNW
jgi:hypothetical protein